tara:strand:- start:199 stop:600 length:402 start_codon:yes stop_codon:yes gene_type:complete
MRITALPSVIICMAVITSYVPGLINRPPEIKELYKASQALRAKSGCLIKQELDPELCKIAQKWAEHMAAKNCMYHGGGEQIIARGYKTPKSVLNAWVCSPPHKKWIFCNKKKVGFGYAKSKSGHPYWAGVYRN